MKTEIKDPKQSDEFANMVNLLAVYSEAHNRMEEMQVGLNQDYLESVDVHKKEYADTQKILTETEAALEVIALKHPEWFATRKSVNTPYGKVKFTSGSKLEIPNEEVTIVLIEKEGEKNKEFKIDAYLRTAKKLDLEALEKMDDVQLTRFRIKRVPTQTFKVEPAKLDMGKAVKEAVEKEAA